MTDLKSIYNGTMKYTYNGVLCLKNPFDFAIYQQIIFNIAPDLILEIGTNHGGSALYLADLLNVTSNGIVYSIDITDNDIDKKVMLHPRIKLFSSGWQNFDVGLMKKFKKVIVIDDGSHQYKDVLGALNKFSSFVTNDSYYIVEDGVINQLGLESQYDGGPLRAINDFLKGNKNFMVDRYLCNYFGESTTFNTDGYLKRL
jgi:cephalosporin hydroxylase